MVDAKERLQECHGRILDLLDRIQDLEKLRVRLALDLLRFVESDGPALCGFETMKVYYRDQLGISPSTGRALLQDARFMRRFEAKVPIEAWEELGITKVRLLAMANPPARKVPGLVKRFMAVPTRQMRAELR